ncbi:MAG: fimbria/pilus periplasmic chaperone [Syntrophales bacterium]|nr:fimbria/pilus periplasmic chaperone [Syntrophales bacterium]
MKKLSLVFLFVLMSTPIWGANIEINPVKIFLDPQNRIEKIAIKNQDDAEINIRVKAFRWRQGEDGQDKYDETENIIVVPRILKLKPGEEKIIRIGINQLPKDEQEESYRIYIEEVPIQEGERKGAVVKLYMKIGIPVFVTPAKSQPKIEIENPTIENKELRFKIINRGNVHRILSEVVVLGKDNHGIEIFNKKIGGWYLLTGAAKLYAIPFSTDGKIKIIHITVNTSSGTAIAKEFSLNQIFVKGVNNEN